MKRLADRRQDSGSTREVLNGLLALCVSSLQQRLSEALTECEKQLVRLADKATLHQQNACFDSMKHVKEGRADVGPRFFCSLENALARLGEDDAVGAGYGAGVTVGLSLADSVHLDESLVLSDIASRVELRLREPLYSLGHRLGALCARTRIPVEAMPLGPRCIAEALRYATALLDLPQEHRLVLYRCFERVVMSMIGICYGTLNDFLVEKNILPTLHVLPTGPVAIAPIESSRQAAVGQRDPGTAIPLRSPVSAARVEPRAGDGFGALKLLLAQCRQAEAYTASGADLQSALAALQQQGIVGDSARTIRSGEDIQRQVLGILQERSVDGRVPRIDNDDADAIELVAMLFEFLSFRAMADGLAPWVMETLQFPIVRAALDDKRFFLDRLHPARRLLNDLVEAVRFWVDEAEAEKDPGLMDQFKSIAMRVACEYQGEAQVFLAAQQELSRLLDSLSRKMDAAERRHVEAAIGNEKLEYATLVAREAIAQRLAARKPNEFLRGFLQRAWVDVIAIGLLREADSGPGHARRVLVVDQLLALDDEPSLASCAHAELRAELEAGLNLIGLHAQDVQAIVHGLLSIAPAEADPISQTELAIRLKGKARFGSEQKSAAAQHAAAHPGVLASEEQSAIERLQAMPVGTWFEFKTAADGEIVRRKLSWSSTRTGRCLLMSQRRTPSEHTFMQLAREMSEGRMRIVSAEPVPLIDRALSDIGDTLKNFSALRPGNRPPASTSRERLPDASVPSGLAEGEKQTRKVRTLLLVDDEENILRALRRLLRGDDYQILTATSVAEACVLLDQHAVQVIVSDQRMPELSGTQFLANVKAMYPDTVRILLSGYSDAATVTDAINRGAISKFLTKPWDDEDLREQIREAFLAAELS